MRRLLAIVAALALTNCATAQDKRFAVGESDVGYVIIGVAEESGAAQEASYTMLWRRVNPETGQFTSISNHNTFEARTNDGGSLRVRGIPGEFSMGRLAPGTWALDSVFARIRDRRVTYVAQGIIGGPERPAFEVRAGQAVYLGVWQVRIDGVNAVASPWRLDEADKDAVIRAARETRGEVTLLQPQTSQVPCTPERLNAVSTREVCG